MNNYNKQMECACKPSDEDMIRNNSLRNFMLETQELLEDDLSVAYNILVALDRPSDSKLTDCDENAPFGMIEYSESMRNKADELNYVLKKIACMLGI